MGKPALFALVATLLIAAQNAIIERKLAQLSPQTTQFLFAVITAIIVLLAIFFSRQLGFQLGTNLILPRGQQWLWLILGGLLITGAGFLILSGYNRGGSVMTLTTTVILMPVIASIMKIALGGGFPSATQVLAYFLAAGAVILMMKA